MDVLYFLKRRTRLIRLVYEQTSAQFIEVKRKINDGEPPFDECPAGYDPENCDPPFLEEYEDADDALEFQGQACISSLSSALQLFLDTMRGELGRIYRVPEFDTEKRGWFPAYRQWFLLIGIDMSDSGVDLSVVEQVVVTRNEAQHPSWITETSIQYRGKTAKKFPRPFFGHEFEWERAGTQGGAAQRMFPSLIKIYPEKFIQAVDEVDKLCEYVEKEAWDIGRRRRNAASVSVTNSQADC